MAHPLANFTCSICKDGISIEVNPGDVPSEYLRGVNIMLTFCGHIYHSYCIMRWFSVLQSQHGSCPYCRTNIPFKTCIPIRREMFEADFPMNLEEYKIYVKLQMELAQKTALNEVLKKGIQEIEDELKAKYALLEQYQREDAELQRNQTHNNEDDNNTNTNGSESNSESDSTE